MHTQWIQSLVGMVVGCGIWYHIKKILSGTVQSTVELKFLATWGIFITRLITAGWVPLFVAMQK